MREYGFSLSKSTILSLYRRIRVSENAYSRIFSAVHHIIPKLLEDKPDIFIVHVGINDILHRCDQDQIIKKIQQISITCKNFNVNQVIISGIVSCKRADNSVINYINENLKVEWTTVGYQSLD